MCGIVGYVGSKQALPILLSGLERLEYRGYDSAGVALIENKKLIVAKKAGKVTELKKSLSKKHSSTIGLGHTRWATHGEPNEQNAHPHVSHQRIALVHNGIIENYAALKRQLQKQGQKFSTDTDSEVLAHLIYSFIAQGASLKDATMKALGHVEGTFGIVVLDSHNPNEIAAARRGSPLLLGISSTATIIASDATAILAHTNKIIYLKDDELAVCKRDGYEVYGLDNNPHKRQPEQVEMELSAIEKSGFDHFLYKEIMEQPESVRNALRGRINFTNGQAHLGGLNIKPAVWKSATRLIGIGCGTAAYATLLGKYQLEKLLNLPVQVEVASEFRYRRPALLKTDIAFLLSQSGETADTIACLQELQRRNVPTLGLVNVVGSTIAREVDGGVYLHAGPEISVASTKAFTNMAIAELLLGLYMGQQRSLGADEATEVAQALMTLPEHIEAVLKTAPAIKMLAKALHKHENALYLGRDSYYPVALEASHKLKEISYIHAEAYPTGEMKHGANALIDPSLLVVFLCPSDELYAKSLSNLQEVRARKGTILAVANEGDNEIDGYTKYVLKVPKTSTWTGPIVMNIALQLLAYFVAVARGTDVDQPRNLAKSVTVE